MDGVDGVDANGRGAANPSPQPPAPSPQTVGVCTGAGLRAALLAATVWLEGQAAAVNALNVFPVPDGDTGTNMALTMRAAVKEVEDAAVAPRTVGEVAARVEYGALMGARGNSGVILSQVLRGFARALQGKETFDGLALAEALQAAGVMAYKAVIKPVEGTMLTVARETAEAALVAARKRNDLAYVVGEALSGARASLRRTPDLLDLLRQAGVVDAGGQGLVVLLEGVWRHMAGEPIDLPARAPTDWPTIDLAALHNHHPDDFGYCTNFMIRGEAMPYEQIRHHLAAEGHSTVIVGDERLIKVHLHTLNPGAALAYAVQFGALTQIKIDNMDDQRAEFAARQAPAAPTGPASGALPSPIALLAVAAGDGFARILTSLGVTRVIAGGQTMNPSAQEILAAIEAVPQSEVIVLPNNGNIVMAARQAAGLTAKRVEIVPSQNLPQGLAALLAVQADADLATNAAAMRAALAPVKTGEVTRAVRSVVLGGVQVQAGDVIALVDDAVVAATQEADAALLALLTALGAEQGELITLYHGRDVAPAARERARTLVGERFPHQTLELLEGGQPHYDFIVSVE